MLATPEALLCAQLALAPGLKPASPSLRLRHSRIHIDGKKKKSRGYRAASYWVITQSWSFTAFWLNVFCSVTIHAVASVTAP